VATALFTSRGPGRFGLAHYSFAEFLAAEWVRENELTDAQVRQLLLTSDAAILPTLRNVAAWLAGSDPDRYGWLVELEPDIAFGGALDLPSDHLRRIAVASLFANVRTEMSQRRDYSGLRYPDLANELRIELRSGDEDRALLACAIAADCQLNGLVDDLATLVFDEQVSMRLRIRAAAAIDRSHADQPTHVLAPLVTADLADDTDELLGIALTASWPHAVDLETVLTVLRRPRQRNLFGMYRHFMSYELASSLQPEHRDPLLGWLLGVERNDRLDAFDTLADAIVRLACEHPDPASDRLLATLLWRRTAHSEGLLVDTIRPDNASDPLRDDSRRRQLLTAMTSKIQVLLDEIDADPTSIFWG
jgi:hypothetical protein